MPQTFILEWQDGAQARKEFFWHQSPQLKSTSDFNAATEHLNTALAAAMQSMQPDTALITARTTHR